MLVYRITYLPWENNTENKPFMYIGSTSQDLNKYFGTMSHKDYKEMWKLEAKQHSENFKKEILCECITNNKKDLLQLEYDIQKQLDVCKDSNYFNRTYAAINGSFGMVMEGSANPMWGVKRSEEWKTQQSIRMLEKGKDLYTKLKRSLAQTEAQNKQETINKKSILQKEHWEINPNMENCKNGWFPATKIILKDTEFESQKKFYEWLKENNIEAEYTKKYDLLSTLTLDELKLLDKAKKFVGNTKFSLNEIYYIVKYNIRIVCKKNNISFYNSIKNIKSRFNNKLKEIEELIIDVLDSEELSKRFLFGVRNEIIN